MNKNTILMISFFIFIAGFLPARADMITPRGFTVTECKVAGQPCTITWQYEAPRTYGGPYEKWETKYRATCNTELACKISH